MSDNNGEKETGQELGWGGLRGPDCPQPLTLPSSDLDEVPLIKPDTGDRQMRTNSLEELLRELPPGKEREIVEKELVRHLRAGQKRLSPRIRMAIDAATDADMQRLAKKNVNIPREIVRYRLVSDAHTLVAHANESDDTLIFEDALKRVLEKNRAS